jgi:hypothetical protein
LADEVALLKELVGRLDFHSREESAQRTADA